MNVFHVVPSVEETDGIGQYALRLVGAANALGVGQHHTVIALSGILAQSDAALPTPQPTAPNPVIAALLRVTDGVSAVVVHLSHYGYAKRGNPTWLALGVEKWKRTNPNVRIVTMFHELFALGPPWRSSFWLSPVQRSISRRLLSLSDHAVTNTPRYAAILRGWNQTVPITVLPVFSNVGEAELIKPTADREALAVVFGRAGVEDLLYGERRRQLAKLATRLEINRIIDIGPRRKPPPVTIGPAAVEPRGALPSGEISAILSEARYGFLAYWPALLGKSGVLAAYAAHGVIPVLLPRRLGISLGVAPDPAGLYINGRWPRTHETWLAALQADLTAWYAAHSLDGHVERWTGIVGGGLAIGDVRNHFSAEASG